MSRTASEQTENQRNNEQHYKNIEQDFSDFGRTRRNAAKAKYRRDNRDHEKDDGDAKHFLCLSQM